VSPNRADTCISPRTLKVRAVISTTLLDIHRAYVPGFDPAFAIGNAEEPLLTPGCGPTILADPAPTGVVVTHHGYAMTTHLGIADALIDPTAISKKVIEYGETPDNRSLGGYRLLHPIGIIVEPCEAANTRQSLGRVGTQVARLVARRVLEALLIDDAVRNAERESLFRPPSSSTRCAVRLTEAIKQMRFRKIDGWIGSSLAETNGSLDGAQSAECDARAAIHLVAGWSGEAASTNISEIESRRQRRLTRLGRGVKL
jgi:hypothetical protein